MVYELSSLHKGINGCQRDGLSGLWKPYVSKIFAFSMKVNHVLKIKFSMLKMSPLVFQNSNT